MTLLKPAVAPGYVLLCLLLGGSGQGIWANAVLQLLAIAIIAWAVLTRKPVELSANGRRLLNLTGLLALLFALQLVPLPPAVWTLIPGREFVADGYRMLGIPLPWQPLSLAPYDTLASGLALLPPIAVLAGMLRLGAFNDNMLTMALVGGAVASVLVGIVQVTSGDPSWYFYRFSNFGTAAGFFANSNHMAALLLVCMPFVAATMAGFWRRARNSGDRSLVTALAAGAAAVLAIGILINGSSAILLLGPPVVVACAMMVMRLPAERLRKGFLLAALLLVAGAAAIGLLVKDGTSVSNQTSVETRAEIWSRSAEAVGDHWLTGSGIGTFEQIYQRYEDPVTIDRFFVNHAHNDYLEVILETGVAGLLLIILFLAWWVARAAEAWRSPGSSDAAKAATIASAALLLHSFVDFPLRTAALASVMAMALALMAGARGVPVRKRGDEQRPARHAEL